jgi:hypothetical protein
MVVKPEVDFIAKFKYGRQTGSWRKFCNQSLLLVQQAAFVLANFAVFLKSNYSLLCRPFFPLRRHQYFKNDALKPEVPKYFKNSNG